MTPVAAVASSPVDARVLYVDEMRHPREASANWAWCLIPPRLAVFNIEPLRARNAITDLIGEVSLGVVVSDRCAG